MKIHLTAGARPNFMKIAPLYRELKKHSWAEVRLIHTGQHYDQAMSQAFFQDFGLSAPDINLAVGSGSQAEQTAGVLVAYEKILLADRPDWVVVVGDVNSTLACTLAAKKLNLRVAHLEAGLRSFDREMPEEINRLLTDAIADLLLTPSPDADLNLQREGVAPARIVRVGNIMIDCLLMMTPQIEPLRAWRDFNLEKGGYALATLHRPSNVDFPDALRAAAAELARVQEIIPLIFPVHPRTRKKLMEFGLWDALAGRPNLVPTEPLGYIQFMSLVFGSKLLITDSGGIQEETSWLDIPCLTWRNSTERPITTTHGTNELTPIGETAAAVRRILAGAWKKRGVLELWDGQTAARTAAALHDQIF
ncbi:MAG: UDP-N-acetylglucosamine 2-epimerase (non-hydrolyzing) [Pseudomonadota bacterium]